MAYIPPPCFMQSGGILVDRGEAGVHRIDKPYVLQPPHVVGRAHKVGAQENAQKARGKFLHDAGV